MFDFLISNLERGFEHIKNNRQIGYTILVALVIFASFFYITNRFTDIAKDAQDRLISVRIGSLQDAFVVFAGDELSDPELLSKRMREIAEKNKTITEFRVVEFINGKPVVIAGINEDIIGSEDILYESQYRFTSINTGESFTFEEKELDGRFFRTVRAITDEYGEVLAVVMTRETLSDADKRIDDNIRNSLFVFVGIVVFVMFLFFRHARIIDYAVLYERLKGVDQLKDDFIAMASHELRTPLTVIRGYMEYILGAKGLTESEKTYAQRISASAKQLEELVSDMLDVSRIEQGRMSFEFEDVNIAELIDDIIVSFTPIAEEKGLTITAQEVVPMNVRADVKRLRQVLVNIVGNAIKYTPKGSVTINAHRIEKIINIRVSDTGLGIDAKAQKQLFEKFYRVRTKETEEIRGTGLGLWLSREIMRNMKGDIQVESITGVGTHFIVTIPMKSVAV